MVILNEIWVKWGISKGNAGLLMKCELWNMYCNRAPFLICTELWTVAKRGLKIKPLCFLSIILPAYNLVYYWIISGGIFVFLIASATNFVRPKSRMIEPIGHSPAAADSNLVFRIRYGEHNNIIGLITERGAVLAVPYNSLSKLVYFFYLCSV